MHAHDVVWQVPTAVHELNHAKSGVPTLVSRSWWTESRPPPGLVVLEGSGCARTPAQRGCSSESVLNCRACHWKGAGALAKKNGVACISSQC